ncbi:MAG: NUDIX hydrolase [Micrococcales bacterium]|nr:NUDIX hydrolase [Micrococcales bacterium]
MGKREGGVRLLRTIDERPTGSALLIAAIENQGAVTPCVVHPGTAACLCYDAATSQVLLVRQSRPVVGRDTLEVPSGIVEDGEDPLETARRETLEETGIYGEDLRLLGKTLSSVGMSTELIHLFWTDDWARLDCSKPELDSLWVPLDSAVQLVQSEGGDSKTLCSLLLLLLELSRLRTDSTSAE